MHKFNQLAAFALAFLAATSAWAQQGNARGPMGESPYNIIPLWHQPFAERGFAFECNSGLIAECPARSFIAQRGNEV